MKAIAGFIIFCIGAYALLDWAADNPRSVKKIHNKVDSTVEQTVDKGNRVASELAK